MKNISVFFMCVTCVNYSAEIDLRSYEKKVISQHGEDGVIEKIFEVVGTASKYCVEFGADDGHYRSNTKILRDSGWTGLLLEGSHPDDLAINLHQEFITAENICSIFHKYNVPHEFDFCSIDIDRNDWYVWRALAKEYRPRVVVIECAQVIDGNDDRVIIYDANAMWDGSEYTGATLLALYNLGRHLGYSLVYQEAAGVNAFFIRDDVIAELEVHNIRFLHINDVAKLYRGSPWVLDQDRLNTQFVASQCLLSGCQV